MHTLVGSMVRRCSAISKSKFSASVLPIVRPTVADSSPFMTIAIPRNLRSFSSIAFSRSLKAASASQIAASTFPNVSNVKARKTMPIGCAETWSTSRCILTIASAMSTSTRWSRAEIVDGNCPNSFFVSVQLFQQADLGSTPLRLGDGQIVASDVVRHTDSLFAIAERLLQALLGFHGFRFRHQCVYHGFSKVRAMDRTKCADNRIPCQHIDEQFAQLR